MNVYFIGDGCGQVKIGRAADVWHRLSDLQVGSPQILSVLRVIEGAGAPTEKWLHRRYKEHRINGEWFWLMPEMLTVVVPDELPKRVRFYRDEIETSYEAGTITAQERRDWRNEGKEPERVHRVREQVNADMKAQLEPELHALYDLYFKV